MSKLFDRFLQDETGAAAIEAGALRAHKLPLDEARGLYARDNFFDRPLQERRAQFDLKLSQALAARKAKGK
jgi:hypothetical protein